MSSVCAPSLPYQDDPPHLLSGCCRRRRHHLIRLSALKQLESLWLQGNPIVEEMPEGGASYRIKVFALVTPELAPSPSTSSSQVQQHQQQQQPARVLVLDGQAPTLLEREELIQKMWYPTNRPTNARGRLGM